MLAAQNIPWVCIGQSSPAGSRASSVERQRDSIDRLSQPRHLGMHSPSIRRPWGSPARADTRGTFRDAQAHENAGNPLEGQHWT